MKKILFIFTILLSLMMTSCGISREATSNSNITQTEVVLSHKNYKVVGIATGESSQNYWFGFGGLSKKSMGQSALNDMYKNANLKDSQAIIDVHVAYKHKFIIIYYGVKAKATGTIIEFID
jgi:lipoprotein